MSTKTDKRKKKLQSFAKRRANRPEATVIPTGALKVSGAVEKRMVRDHESLLYNIEFTLKGLGDTTPDVDDQVIESILKHVITRKDSDDALIDWGIEALAETRLRHDDASDEVWNEALRVVYTSVKRHGSGNSGDRHYLNFISQYVR